MKNQTNARILSVLNFYVRFASIVSISIAFGVLLGWQFGIGTLQSVLPGLVTMKPLTALGLLLAAVALWLSQYQGARQQLLGPVCAALVAGIGGVVLLEYLFNFDIGIGHRLFSQAVLAEGGLHPGRPAPATAFCLLLLGLALLTMPYKSKVLMSLFAIPILLIGLLALVGYIYEVSSLYQIGPYTSMALHTAILLVILTSGVLSARPDHPLIATLTSDLAGGVMARRLVFAAVFVPFILGWLRLQGELLGWYDGRFGLALFATSNIVIFVGLIYWNAGLLNQTDMQRENTFYALSASQAQLTGMIGSAMDAIITIDADQKIMLFNTSAEKMFGYEAEMMLGQSLERLLPERSRAIHRDHVQRFGEMGATTRAMGSLQALSGRRANGEEFPIEASISQIEIAEKKIFTVILRDISERRQAEENLRANERRLHLAATAGGVGIWDWDIVKDELIWDESMYSLYGIDKRDFGGAYHAWTSTLHPEDQPFTEGEIQAALRGEREYAPEFRIIRPDGVVRVMKATSQTIRDEDGKALRMVGTNVDITESKQAEENLRAAEAKYRAMIENIPAIVYLAKPDQLIGVTYISPRIEILGFSQDEWIADPKMWVRQIHSEDREQVLAKVHESVTSDVLFNAEYRITTRDGAIKWFQDRALLIRDDQGEPGYLQGLMQDITERKQSEEAIAYQAQLLSNVSDAIVASDEQFHLTAWNAAAEAMYGWRADEVLGRIGVEILRTEFTNVDSGQMWRQIAETDRWRGEATQLRKDGTRVPVDLSSMVLRDESGKISGYLSVNRDITERKQIEEEIRTLNAELEQRVLERTSELRASEAQLNLSLKEKEALLKEIHHRVKNNLQVIASLLRLQSDTLEDPATRDLFLESQRRVRSMALVHEQLYQSNDLANINFAEYIRSLVNYVRRSYARMISNVEVRVEIPEITLDIDQAVPLGLIINELVSNSLKHAFPNEGSHAEGELWVVLKNESAGTLSLEIGDNGLGIPDEVDIEQSTSMGLQLVQSFVLQLHGRVTVRRQPGTTFIIVFPERNHNHV